MVFKNTFNRFQKLFYTSVFFAQSFIALHVKNSVSIYNMIYNAFAMMPLLFKPITYLVGFLSFSSQNDSLSSNEEWIKREVEPHKLAIDGISFALGVAYDVFDKGEVSIDSVANGLFFLGVKDMLSAALDGALDESKITDHETPKLRSLIVAP